MPVRSGMILLLGVALLAAPAAAGTVSPRLEDALLHAGPDDLVPIVVLMEAFPDQHVLLAEVRPMTRAQRRAHVLGRMRTLADESQGPVHRALAIEGAGFADVRVLWGINGVALRAIPRVIETLANVHGVRTVLHDHAIARQDTGPTGGDTSGPNPGATVRGDVVAMGADRVWNELGYTGAGVIIAVIDTGIDRDHPDLADHIWTNLGEIGTNGIDDDDNGYIDDTWGWDFCTGSNDPSAGSHGTQVAGQAAGDGTNGTQTGMAPDAELMSLGIDCDTPSRAWEASDYALAQGADVITQSYSWWWTDQPDYEAFRRQTDTSLAAGVLHVNSAGNSGAPPLINDRPIPYNISTPGNCPAPWIHPDQTIVGGVSGMVAVGDIHYGTDVIASSSSLGPSAWEDIRANTDPGYPHAMPPEFQDYPYENGAQMGLIKPDVSAYGSGTTSTCPGTGYCGFSGTSSAAPHVSGTVALMLEANPEATPAELAEALMTTAEHRGDPGKNNVYGTGLVQTFDAVSAVEAGVVYHSHTVDDVAHGNGDGMLDPGETVTMAITVESRNDAPIDDLEVVLWSPTPGVTIHDHHRVYPSLPARGSTATSPAPHYTLTIDPSACSTVIEFVLDARYGGSKRKATFHVRVGEETPMTLLYDDFESAGGWTSDPGTASDGQFTREDPVGVTNQQNDQTNPEDDTSDPGTMCWVTGSGGGPKDDSNDVDGGYVRLLSPPFGRFYMLSLTLSYDRFYFDDASGGDFYRAEISDDGGTTWTEIEYRVTPSGGWGRQTHDLLALFPATDDMRLRFTVQDGSEESVVEAAVDEVLIEGIGVDCQPFTPAAAQAPNAVGDTVRIDKDPGGHAVLTWTAPPVDGGHDAATLYRIQSAASPAGPFAEIGSATETRWVDVDAVTAPDSRYYRVVAENAGGTE